MGVVSPTGRSCEAFVRVVGTSTSLNARWFPLYEKYARLLKFATDVGTLPIGFVARSVELQAGAEGVVISMTPKMFAPAPLNPGCVTRIFVLTTAIVGGVHAPEVAGDEGTFAPVTPLIVINVFVSRLNANG